MILLALLSMSINNPRLNPTLNNSLEGMITEVAESFSIHDLRSQKRLHLLRVKAFQRQVEIQRKVTPSMDEKCTKEQLIKLQRFPLACFILGACLTEAVNRSEKMTSSHFIMTAVKSTDQKTTDQIDSLLERLCYLCLPSALGRSSTTLSFDAESSTDFDAEKVEQNSNRKKPSLSGGPLQFQWSNGNFRMQGLSDPIEWRRYNDRLKRIEKLDQYDDTLHYKSIQYVMQELQSTVEVELAATLGQCIKV